MTNIFPDVNSKQIIKVIEQMGFEFIRQSGSGHAIYRRSAMAEGQRFLFMGKNL